MNSRYLNHELLVGVLLLAVGAVGFFGAKETAAVSDPARNVFPYAVFVGLMGVGTAIAIRGAVMARERLAAIPLRPCAAVTAAVLAFAVLIDRAGLAAAVVATVLLATLGFRTPRLWAGFVFGICMAATMFVLFAGFLGQPIRLAPGF